MSYFKKKFYKKFMSLTRTCVDVNGALPIPTLSCWNMLNRDGFSAPYIEAVKKYIERRGDYLQKRLLLVTEDRNSVMKAATMIADHVNDEEDDGFFDECNDDFYEGEKVLWVDLPSMPNVDKQELYYQTVIASAKQTGLQNILLTGVNTVSDWDMVLQSLIGCNINNQYVELNPEQLGLPVVQRMIYELGFEVLRLPKLDRDYYETQVLDVLLENADYTLSVECEKKEWLRRLQKKRGVLFEEEDIATFLDMGVESAVQDGGRTELHLCDFKDTVSVDDKSAWSRLMDLTGLSNIKIVAEEEVALMLEKLRNEKLQCGREHMIFYGNPGTGKSTCGSLLAEVYDEEGCGNGSFVMATRKDLVGEYVGHTAPKVAKRFEEARGGILFVDEAGFFLNKESGGFVNEALKEFVRYMEQYTDVTVIFAMYPEEAKEFLKLDAGLNSRIKRNVQFPDYSEKELLAIAVKMFEDNGYHLSKKAYPLVKEYIRVAKNKEKEQFGNARNMRNLVDTSIKEISLRHFRNESKSESRTIIEQDLKRAIAKLKGIEITQATSFGFVATKSYVQ